MSKGSSIVHTQVELRQCSNAPGLAAATCPSRWALTTAHPLQPPASASDHGGPLPVAERPVLSLRL